MTSLSTGTAKQAHRYREQIMLGIFKSTAVALTYKPNICTPANIAVPLHN